MMEKIKPGRGKGRVGLGQESSAEGGHKVKEGEQVGLRGGERHKGPEEGTMWMSG